MSIPSYSGIAVVDGLSAYLKSLSSQRALEQFDPEDQKIRRWQAISHAVITLTTPFQTTFLRNAGANSPFAEISRERYQETLSLGSFPVLPTPNQLTDVIETYELLLHEDFAAGNLASSSPKSRAVTRRNGGAYYTPKHLADECVRVACETYIETKLGLKYFLENDALTKSERRDILNALSSARVVDPSCGVARFLVSYIHLVGSIATNWFGDEDASRRIAQVAGNIWGFDIDPVALGLSRLVIGSAILSFSSEPVSLTPLLTNLVMGNLLIKPCQQSAYRSAIAAVSRGAIYSSALARPESVAQEQFDLVLGNPPWEKIRLEDRDFLLHLHTSLSMSTSKNDRAREINSLKSTAPKVFNYLEVIRTGIDCARKSIAADAWFVNSAHGELNTCPLFVELGARLINPDNGVVALLVKTSTVTHHANRRLFQYLLDRKLICKVFEFSNKGRLFQIDSRERFSLLVLAPRSEAITLGMNLVQPADLRSSQHQTSLTIRDLKLLNPNSGMLPMPQGLEVLELLRTIYSNNRVFSEVYATARFGRLVHLTMHADDIFKASGDGRLAVQEGKFIERYDGRFSTFKDVPTEKRYTARSAAIKINESEKAKPDCLPVSRYFISADRWKTLTKNHKEQWSIFWRSTTSASNARTCIATVLPHLPAIQSLQMAQFPDLSPADLSIVLALMNSKVFDFIIRNKLSGIDLTQNVIGQASVPPLSRWSLVVKYRDSERRLCQHVSARVAALLSGDERLALFVQGLNAQEHLRKSRQQLQDELDDLVAIAYGLTADGHSVIWSFMKGNQTVERQ